MIKTFDLSINDVHEASVAKTLLHDGALYHYYFLLQLISFDKEKISSKDETWSFVGKHRIGGEE